VTHQQRQRIGPPAPSRVRTPSTGKPWGVPRLGQDQDGSPIHHGWCWRDSHDNRPSWNSSTGEYSTREEKEDQVAGQKIRIRLKAYDHEAIDASARKIVETVTRTGASV